MMPAHESPEPPFMPDDPFLDTAIVETDDPWLPPDDLWMPDDHAPLEAFPPASQDGLQGFERPEPTDDGWTWHDARLLGLERAEGEGVRHEIGVIDVYANANTGDLGASYLPIAAYDDPEQAAAHYADLLDATVALDLPVYDLPQFVETQVSAGDAPARWRSAGPHEYAAYEQSRGLEWGDDSPPEAALDPLLETAMSLGGVPVERETPVPDAPAVENSAAFQALSTIGIAADDFDPNQDPPPFFDATTGTAYWIGVFQPDKDDPQHCVTGILSLGRSAETGELEAQLAPCVPGSWDKVYSAAEYLIGVAQKGGIEQVFDTAEGMALATDQRDLWENTRGVPLEADIAQDIATYTREQWEVQL